MVRAVPEMIIVAGAGRGSGKTSLICSIIEGFSKNHSIVALKICPYFHELSLEENIIAKSKKYVIIKEQNRYTGKDSSRMLNSGAAEVYYIQVKDDHLAEAFEEFYTTINNGSLIICESGGLRKFVKPGILLICHQNNMKNLKESTKYLEPLADKWIEFNGDQFQLAPDSIKVKNKEWVIGDN